jgi:predicted aspartyl protease
MGVPRAYFTIALVVTLSTSVVPVRDSVAQSPSSPVAPARTYWSHNGSIVYLLANGSLREFYYDQPRQGMIAAGAKSGSLLFRGRSVSGRYIGIAFIFDPRCGQRSYEVSGPILDNYERVILQGQAPRVDPGCRSIGFTEDKLTFTLVKSEGATPSAFDRSAAVAPPATAADQVRMEGQGGVYVVPVRFNDMITLNAIVDSGASDMSVPADIVSTLIRTKTITDQDFLGEQTYVLADGSKVPSKRFRIRSLMVGNKTVENVTAGVASVQGEILLGQSFLSRFKSWSIDNESHTLTLR